MKTAKHFMLAFSMCLAIIASISLAAFADSGTEVTDNTFMVSMPNISAGYAHTVAIQEGGNVVAVGANHSGQCSVDGWESVVAVKAGFDVTFGITNEGYVLAAGRNSFGQFTPEWEYLQDISVNLLHVVGLRPDGTVLALGNNEEGACNTSSWRNITEIAAGGWHTVGLREDGTVVAAGRNNEGQCDVQDWKNVVAIAAGGFHTIGLTSDGRVLAVGDNQNGQCEVQDWYDMVAVDCGLSHTVGLRKDGTVVAVGTNSDGQCDVHAWKNIVAVSTGDIHTVGLTKDGTVVSTGQNSSGQRNVDDWRGIRVGSPYPRTVKARTPNVPIRNFSYSFDAINSTMTICGNGAIPDCSGFSTFRTPWSFLAGQLETVVIENGITRIGEFAFMGLATMDPEIGVKTFYIPKSVTEIGKGNFMILLSLRDIYYEGTEDEWDRLMGDDEALPGGIRVHCQSGGSYSVENAITYPQTGNVKLNPFRDAFVGDTVLFGKYEQDNNPNNGPEDISWIVLDKSPDGMLVISEYALDCQPYNKKYAELTWETCSLRRWLNDSFLNAAFTSYEQSLISTAKVSADKNPEESKSDPGNITQDQVFLLSIKEIDRYFDSDYARFCKPTAYATEQGCKVYPDINTCWWWTRTPGCDNYYVTDVRGDGSFNYIGSDADRDYLCIRPAMWIDLSA